MRSISLGMAFIKKWGKQRKYDPEFEQKVLRLMAQGKTAIEIIQDPGITPDIIYTWRRKEKRLIKVGARNLNKVLAAFSKEPQNY